MSRRERFPFCRFLPGGFQLRGQVIKHDKPDVVTRAGILRPRISQARDTANV
jgi:hypothetical protein